MAIIESSAPVTMTQREIAVIVAKAVSATGLPVADEQIRNDVKYIQIDPILLEEKVTDPHLGVRVRFMTKDRFSIDLNIDCRHFCEDPKGYMTDIFENLKRMVGNAHIRRHQKREETLAIYNHLTKGAANA